MIWAIVNSGSDLCWLYTVSPSSLAKNIISLISILVSHLGMSMWRVFSCLVRRGCLLWPMCSLDKTLRLYPASFYTLRTNFPISPGISWLPALAFQSPMMERTSFFSGKDKKQQLEQDEKQDWFKIGKGVCKGCILAHCFFNFYAEYTMWNARLYETRAGIKIAKRNINNLRYADDTTPLAEIEEELKSLLM